MSANDPQTVEGADDSGLHVAEDIVAEVESGPRSPSFWLSGALIIGLCAAWSIFQLWHAEDPFGAKVARYIHLSFAMALAFLAYPAFKSTSDIQAPKDWRRYLIKKAILLIVFLGISAVLFQDVLQGFLIFVVLVGAFSLFGIVFPLRARRHLLTGSLLAFMAVLLWANMDGILKGLETDSTWEFDLDFVLFVIPVAIPWNPVADILFWILTIAATVEAVRRLLSGLIRIFLAHDEIGGVVSSLLGLGHATRIRSVIPAYDFIFAAVAVCCTLYLVYDFDEIIEAGGLVSEPQQMIFGLILILLLLEAARRSLGLPLTVLAGVFLVYSLYSGMQFGRSIGLPDVDAFLKSVLPPLRDFVTPPPQPLDQIVGEMYLTDTSVFGVPIEVSVSFVFLFVLFGALLDRAGAGKYFIDVAFAGLGSQRAGPAKAAVLASGATGLISGSSIANTVTTGTFTIPLMKKVGLPAYKAGAIEVAASTNGQLMPPIMGAAAFIMAEIIGIKYIDVVRAAFIPAIISYLALFWVVHLEALKLGIRRIPKDELPAFLKTFLRGLHYLVPIIVLVYFLIVVRRTPIQSAVYALLSLVVIMLLQRPMIAWLGLGLQRKQGNLNPDASLLPIIAASFLDSLKDIWDGMIAGARNMISVGIATATAGIIVGIVQITGLTGRFVTIIEQLAFGNIILVLILTAGTSMILGMGLPTTANYIIMASLTAPVILQIGEAQQLIFPVIAVHLFVFYFGILADDTPPVGLAAYAAAAIARADPIKTGIQGFTYDLRTAILPFMFVFNTEILMIAEVTTTDKWVWIDNWLMIGYVFFMALAAMVAFTSFIQGYFADKCNWPERLLLLLCSVLMFVPHLVVSSAGLDAETAEYARRILQVAALGVMVGLYLVQGRRVTARGGHIAELARERS